MPINNNLNRLETWNMQANRERILEELSQPARQPTLEEQQWLTAIVNIKNKSLIHFFNVLVNEGIISGRFNLFNNIGLTDSLEDYQINFNSAHCIREYFRNNIYGIREECANITELSLDGCYLSDLPEEMLYFPRLEELNLSRNRFEHFPEVLGYLPALKKLDMSMNKLSEWSNINGNFATLKSLNLAENQFTVIPQYIMERPILRTLTMHNNNIRIIPNGIKQMMSLKKLDLSDNNIYNISESFGQLANLSYLNLSANKLNALPDSFSDLKLKILNLYDNEFSEIPSSILRMDSLKELDMANNSLKIIPPGMNLLENLKKLNLSFNMISNDHNYESYIDESFCELPNLSNLNLSDNGLEKLPDNFEKLRSLSVLDLSSNNLKFKPRFLNPELEMNIDDNEFELDSESTNSMGSIGNKRKKNSSGHQSPKRQKI